MKVGVFAVLFGQMGLEEAMDYIKATGCDAVEIGTGAYPGAPHCPLDELVADKSKALAWKKKITDRGLEISALSCHGNPIHPEAKIAKEHDAIFRKTIDLASMLGIETVVNFSGCPGSFSGDIRPNWVTCPWPPDFLDILKYQWDDVAVPYWKEINGVLKAKGVRVGLEMHPGFIVYNTETMLRLRERAGDRIGVNFDPSHLFWQGMDPVYAIRKLGEAGAIFHFHAKDCKIDELVLEWEENKPLVMNATLVGGVFSIPATFTVGTDESDTSNYYTPVGGTFKYDVDSATPVTSSVKGGKITMKRSAEAQFFSGAIEAGDVFEGGLEIAVALSVVPDDMLLWKNIVTGSTSGTTLLTAPQYGSFEHTFVFGTDSLKITCAHVDFRCDMPEADPKGGA